MSEDYADRRRPLGFEFDQNIFVKTFVPAFCPVIPPFPIMSPPSVYLTPAVIPTYLRRDVPGFCIAAVVRLAGWSGLLGYP